MYKKIFPLVLIIGVSLFSPRFSFAATDGSGTMSVNPDQAAELSVNNNFSFHFTNTSTDFGGSSKLTLVIPNLWSAPQKTNSANPGYVTVANTTCGSNPSNGVSDITINAKTVSVAISSCDANDTFDLLYSNVTVPASGSYTFTTSTQEGPSGLKAILRSPVIEVLDSTPPTITELSTIDLLSNNTTPSYSFNSTEIGTITYTGSCGNGDLNVSVEGGNVTTFGPLGSGIYSDCGLRVTDSAGNESNTLLIPVFQINTDIFGKGIISFSFDDGYKSIFDNAIPLLDEASIKSTQYIFTEGMFGATAFGPEYYYEFMNIDNILSMHESGHEIAAHTRSHIDLTTPLSLEQVMHEVDGSRLDLLRNIDLPVKTLAYPFGASNQSIETALQSAGLSGGRTVDGDVLNNKATNHYELHGRQVNRDTEIADIKNWIDEASAKKEWLILIFHRVEEDCSPDLYCATPNTLQQIIDYTKDNTDNIDVLTVGEGLSLLNNLPTSDNIAPVIIQDDISAEATSASGAQVDFTPVVTDFDLGVSSLNALCTVPNSIPDPYSGLVFPTVITSGFNFPLGSTLVTCTSADIGGNIGTKEFNVNVVDTTKPETSITNAKDGNNNIVFEGGVTKSDSITVNFIATDAVGVDYSECNLDDVEYGVCASPVIYGSLLGGEHNLKIRSTDTSGNMESTTTLNWTVDLTVPEIAQHDDIEVEATSHDGATVSYDAPAVTDNYDDATTAVCAPSSGSVFVLGETVVTCGASDTAGNAAEETTFKVTVVDTTDPTVSVDTPASPTNANPSITFEVTDNTNTTTECKVDDGTYESCVSPFAPNIVDDGEHTVTVKATDEGGNSTESTTDSFTTDATAPSVSITTGPADASFINYTDVTLQFSAEEGAELECSLNAGSFTPCTPDTNLELLALADGEYTFTVLATDSVGNTANDSRTFTVDTYAPVVDIDTVASPTADSTPEITFSVIDANSAAAECKVDDGEFTSCASPFTPSELADGEHTVYVRATDGAGNTGEADSAAFTVDTTAPMVEITDHPVAYGSAQDVSFAFTVNDENATVECSLDGADFAECDSPIEYTDVSEGEHTFTVRATDELGHVGTDAFDFTVDKTAPVIILVGDEVVTVEVGDDYTEEGATADDNLDSNVEVNINSASVNTSVVGEYTVHYNASDDAGNAAEEVTRAVKVADTVKPTITLLGDNPMYVSLGEDYEEPGADVTDNYDTGITASTSGSVNTGVLGVYAIYYDAVDASGNDADQASREVHVVDSMPPVITLLGDNPLVLHVGDTFTEPGVSITDDVDGDISGNITVGGDTVDTSVFGVYTITYDVVDSSSNEATQVTRIVRVVPQIGDENFTEVLTNQITVTWTTDHPTTSRVIFDTTSHEVLDFEDVNYGYAFSTDENTELVTEHTVIINSGISSGTKYYLRVVSHGSPEAVSEEMTTTTKNTNSSSTSTSSGGGGGGAGAVNLVFINNTNTQNQTNNTDEDDQNTQSGSIEEGEVLGTQTFKFLIDMKYGSKGNDVTELQKRLTAEGVYSGPITGFYGKLTTEAVKKYQKAHTPLSVDGQVGPNTRAVLNNDGINTKESENTNEVLGEETFKFLNNLKRGSQGNDVTELQKRLTAEGVYSGPITGFFGHLTETGVKEYQKMHPPLQTDGMVGSQTRAVLNQ